MYIYPSIGLTLDKWQQAFILWVVANEALQGSTDLLQLALPPRQFVASPRPRQPYHGVLSHQHDALSSQSETDLVHLLRADIVDVDDEDGSVLVEKALELIEVSGLGFGFAPHVFL